MVRFRRTEFLVALTVALAPAAQAQVIDVDKAPQGAIDDSLAVTVAKEASQAVPLGVITPLDISQAPK